MTSQKAQREYNRLWNAMDAVNATGILYDIKPWVDIVCEDAHQYQMSTTDKNAHPILVCLIDKFSQLAGGSFSMPENQDNQAYSFVNLAARGQIMRETPEYETELRRYYANPPAA